MHHKNIPEILPEKAVLVGVITQEQDSNKVNEYLDELEFLAGVPLGEGE